MTITNYSVDVPGTNVTCHMGVYDSAPTVWAYSLWDDDDTLLATGRMDLDGLPWVKPEQVARVAFLLECEYVDTPTAGPW